jgi:hypothetical protein
MDDTKNENATDALRRAGEAVSNLPPVEPPTDLVARTMATIAAGYKPVKRAFWLFRPIINPVARFAAAAVIILALLPMADLTLATPLGTKIEDKVIGSDAADDIEDFVDGLLVRNGPPNYPQYELDAWVGVPRPTFVPVRRATCQKPKGV